MTIRDGQPQVHATGSAPSDLLPVVYEELRALADQYLQNERAGHTLQPTALVHEAFLRLAQAKDQRFDNAGQFFRTAAVAMRHILVNHARDRARLKRGGGARRVPLDSFLVAFEDRSIEMLALDDVLVRLARLDPRQAQVVELRFFCGLMHKEIAEILSVSERTVKDDWFTAKAWIHRELVRDGGDARPDPEGEHDA